MLSGVPKWIKFIIGLLLLPVCAGALRALWLVLRASGSADTIWVPFLGGAACWIVVFILLPKPMWIYVFGHELTHALWTWLFGGEVKKLLSAPAVHGSSGGRAEPASGAAPFQGCGSGMCGHKH